MAYLAAPRKIQAQSCCLRGPRWREELTSLNTGWQNQTRVAPEANCQGIEIVVHIVASRRYRTLGSPSIELSRAAHKSQLESRFSEPNDDKYWDHSLDVEDVEAELKLERDREGRMVRRMPSHRPCLWQLTADLWT